RSESCEKCLNLDAEFSKLKQEYNDLLNKYSQLEKHYISLEVSMQLKQEVFQKDESCVCQNAPKILEYFEKNDLKAQLIDKDTTICKLKDTIKSLRNNNKEKIVDHDRCDLATINAELENSMAKLLSENERLCKEINPVKQVFKNQFDSIKQTRVLQKEQCDSLVNKLELKSAEHKDLKAQIQDKVFVITSLKNDLRKLKGKATVNNAAQIPYATTIVPGMFKLDLEPLAPKLMHNRECHIFYLKHTQDQANILQGLVEQAKAKQPFNNELDFACKHAKRIQELLVYVRDTCPSAIRLSKTKVAITPMNKIKKVTFAEPIATSSTNQETHNFNKPMFHSTGVKCSTSASGSKSLGNTKNNMISQPSRSNKINKVKDQPKSVKTGKNNKNRVKKVKCVDHVMLSRLYFVSGLRMFKTHDRESLSAHELCVDLISGSRDINLYTISLDDTLKSSLICLLSKASKSKSWLWHRRLSHLNFGTLNKLDKDGLARGISRLKFQKDHLCSACALRKSKKSSHQPKVEDTNQEKLYLLHMDLCGPMRVASINGKRYILVIVEDYSRFTWILGFLLVTRLQRKRSESTIEGPGSRLGLYDMTLATPSTGLVSNPVSQQPFQEATAPRAKVLADSPVSISISHDAPSISAVDRTLFPHHAGNELLLVQIYVDDIIFASINTSMCDEFANQMTTKFKMSMMGQMLFFLGLQISQSPRGIFINLSKYASEIVKKYGLTSTDSVDTPMIENKKLDEDL
nr:integrase, catalytic region, zinc finger, CCHC-type, peptidase aspartic, catalytic [Tanacetum cinerariifolium]